MNICYYNIDLNKSSLDHRRREEFSVIFLSNSMKELMGRLAYFDMTLLKCKKAIWNNIGLTDERR